MAWERSFLLWLHSHSGPILDKAFLFSNRLGTTSFLTVVVLAAILWHLIRREYRDACVWIALGIADSVIRIGLKALVARHRPELWPHLISAGGYSFPSGHALGTAAFFPVLAYSLFRKNRRNLIAAFVCAGAISLITGIGRLYLGVHWPTDVLAGWAIGLGLAVVAIRFMSGRASV